MRENRKLEQEANLAGAPLEVFIQYYNKNVPAAFPQATKKTLEQFRSIHPSLFDATGLWVIDKHRKRLMDWLISYRETV